MMEAGLHGRNAGLGRSWLSQEESNPRPLREGGRSVVLTPTKKPAGCARARAEGFQPDAVGGMVIVEHPFRVVKRQFGFVKVRYRGLAKNTGKIVTLFALTNLWRHGAIVMPLMVRCAREREMQRRTSAFHGQRSKIACFSCFFYYSLRQSSGLFRESLQQNGGRCLRLHRVLVLVNWKFPSSVLPW